MGIGRGRIPVVLADSLCNGVVESAERLVAIKGQLDDLNLVGNKKV